MRAWETRQGERAVQEVPEPLGAVKRTREGTVAPLITLAMGASSRVCTVPVTTREKIRRINGKGMTMATKQGRKGEGKGGVREVRVPEAFRVTRMSYEVAGVI